LRTSTSLPTWVARYWSSQAKATLFQLAGLALKTRRSSYLIPLDSSTLLIGSLLNSSMSPYMQNVVMDLGVASFWQHCCLALVLLSIRGSQSFPNVTSISYSPPGRKAKFKTEVLSRTCLTSWARLNRWRQHCFATYTKWSTGSAHPMGASVTINWMSVDTCTPSRLSMNIWRTSHSTPYFWKR
jgi:hypothetical protein